LITPAMDRLAQDSRTWFPLPYEPLHRSDLDRIDQLSVADYFAGLDLSRTERDVTTGVWAEHFNGPAAVSGLTQAMRWCAAASGDWQLLHQATAGYRLTEGTAALAEAIAADG